MINGIEMHYYTTQLTLNKWCVNGTCTNIGRKSNFSKLNKQ